MNEALLERIRTRGHWRINFRPRAYVPQILSLPRCKELVESNKVQLRGWDYPHIQRNEEHGGQRPAGEYYESWTEWQNHLEFWRMYRSAQFLHYLALREDWLEESNWPTDLARSIKPLGALGIVGSIYQITEIFEFIFRLARTGLYSTGVEVSIVLHNTENRALWVDDARRMPFFEARLTGAPSIKIVRELTGEELLFGDAKLSISATLELFENFAWQPSPELVAEERGRFLTGQTYF